MNTPSAQTRYRAVSMEFAAYLDRRYVEMHILTDTGKAIAVVCEGDSIFAIQHHIEQMGRECPQILTWKTATPDQVLLERDRISYEAAISEGWPAPSEESRPQMLV